MERKLEEEHLGSQELTLVLKYSLGTKVSVTFPKLIYLNSRMTAVGWIGRCFLQVGLTIGRHLSTSMTEYYKGLGTRIMNTSVSVESDLQGSPPVKILIRMIIKGLRT